jgi:lipoprotein-anchoring transpeptidase ErfK/SrfK
MVVLERGVLAQLPRIASAVLLGAGLLALAACADTAPVPIPHLDPPKAMYASVQDDGFTVPAAPIRQIPPQFLRQVVDTPASIPGDAGTVVVDPANRFLYLILGGGKAMRYGIGVGKQGFAWSGEAQIKDKQHWPKWFPPDDMIARDPRLQKFDKGQDGGPSNPLGSRALYLWSGNVDTLYRIHGTNDPLSIGKAVSSGCVRMLDQDVIDLYERVPLGSKVIVLAVDGTTTPLADIMKQQQSTLPIKAPPKPQG